MRYLGLSIAAVAACATLAGCNKQANPSQPSSGQPSAGATPPAALTPDQVKAAQAALPAPYNTADLANGESKFALCQTCHTLVEGGPNMTGPNLHGVFGRKAASTPGFNYSDALKATGWTWDAAHVDTWITDPKVAAAGTKMTFAGLKDPKDRTDLIAYLMVHTGFKP
jgi:cytochrome c